MQSVIHKSIGIALVGVGLAPFVCVLILSHSRNWEPLQVPIMLAQGEYRSPEFMTDRDGRYIVNLSFDKLPDAGKQQCLMGIPLAGAICDRNSQSSLSGKLSRTEMQFIAEHMRRSVSVAAK